MNDTSLSTAAASIDDGKLTRYQKVANVLLEEIERGDHPVGSLLPTEHELCARFEVSRYTVREALRRLFEAGLVARRRGAGTTVIATKRPPLYDLSVGSVMDIFNYAKNTQFEIHGVSKPAISTRQAEEALLPPTGSWTTILGVRSSDVDPRPVCVTRVYVNDKLPNVARRLSEPWHIIRDFTEVAFEVPVVRMEQTIRATALPDEDARLLRAEPGSPALRSTRRYIGANETVIQLSDSLHPGDRFSISMTYEGPTPQNAGPASL